MFKKFKKLCEDIDYLASIERNNQIKRLTLDSVRSDIKDVGRLIDRVKCDNRFYEEAIRRATSLNYFLLKCLEEKYDNGLFIASNTRVNGKCDPIVCIKNGKSIAENARSVDISWDIENGCPEISVEYCDRDFTKEEGNG